MEGVRARWVVAVCLGAGFTTLLDQSVLNVVVPALRGSLHAGTASLQWILAGYSLTFGLALVPAGRLGDLYGRRLLFVGGLTVFAAGAIAAATARHGWVVAAARLVQGFGAGTVNPQIIGLFQDLFRGRARARALGAYAFVGGVAGMLGPLLGGAVLQAAGPGSGWRLVLVANLPFAVVTIPLALRFLPPGRPAGHTGDLDLGGLLLLGGTTLAALPPLAGTGGGAWWLLAAGAGLVAFLAWERRWTALGRTAILLPALTRNRGYVLGVLVAMCYFGATLALNLVLSLYLQDGLHHPPLAAAAIALPSAVGFTLTSALASGLRRRGTTVALGVAVAGIAASIASVELLPEGQVVWALAVGQFVTGAAGGFVNSPNQALTLSHAPPGANGLSAALLQLSQRLAASVSIAAVSGIFLATAAAPGGHTAAMVHGAALCLGLAALGLLFAALDRDRRRDRRRDAPGPSPVAAGRPSRVPSED
ncbi:MFS transporter [Dactylosporangium sp. CA-152071]|uniref:MFS transporter n=1 Tax=Dactylosporangium sp. CA-152071 TaxID=3239933 RepID=UPI003D8EF236